MIACLFGEKRVVVGGTVREWIEFVERLDPQILARGDEASKAREILVAASTVPFNGQDKRSD
jgi:hypothetical protein